VARSVSLARVDFSYGTREAPEVRREGAAPAVQLLRRVKVRHEHIREAVNEESWCAIGFAVHQPIGIAVSDTTRLED
jgi:hypothetical protein